VQGGHRGRLGAGLGREALHQAFGLRDRFEADLGVEAVRIAGTENQAFTGCGKFTATACRTGSRT
jgi:hypothetical protein